MKIEAKRKIRSAYFGAALILACSAVWLGCSSAARQERERNVRLISSIAIANLHVRRPLVAGADPAAGPGGADYRSRVAPDSRLDCAHWKSLFREINLGKFRECLKSAKSGLSASYRLKREVAPFLELEVPGLEGDQAPPECLRQVLGRVPVPREIFFQSTEEGRLYCYSSRLDLEADEFLWRKVPVEKISIRIAFPLEAPPRNDEEALSLLISWSLAPFWKQGKARLVSKILPEVLCRICMTKEKVFKETDPPPVLWP